MVRFETSAFSSDLAMCFTLDYVCNCGSGECLSSLCPFHQSAHSISVIAGQLEGYNNKLYIMKIK